ncbi:MAG: 50S ribosomal protein L11 methyltransferase [Deltaproteobacteria bacterium]|nr:50S ribosomal protein L11 methyltransferase [Deltaproteobacteria bacterium]
MIDPETNLFIYEIRKDLPQLLPNMPDTMIGVWNEEDFSYVFFSEPEDEYIERLCSDLDMSVSCRHEMKYKDWQEGLPNLGLSISGVTFVPGPKLDQTDNFIVLDPSVVFGDGNHPTTQTCVEFLVEILRTGRIKSVLDLGCGSGILALTAARLGCRKVVAVDKNRLAVQATKRNVLLNEFEAIIEVREGEARIFLDDQYDLILANLPFSVLRDMVVLKETSSKKAWIVSGINADQAAVLKSLFVEQNFVITRERITSPWVTFVAAKQKYWSELFDETTF